MEIYLGFDPGGEKNFGWAVCSPKANALQVLTTGKADHADEAIFKTLSTIPSNGMVVGAGIDAPLFWAERGNRYVDELIRNAIKKLGARSPGGTVQQINSLRGACLVQGVLVMYLLHRRFPEITITESHPKALLYLLGIASRQISHSNVSLGDLSEYVESDKSCSEHERDAILGAFTAFAQREKRQGWRNLFEEEKQPVTPFDYPVGYWMPWHLLKEWKAT